MKKQNKPHDMLNLSNDNLVKIILDKSNEFIKQDRKELLKILDSEGVEGLKTYLESNIEN
jgi:hypothetical protein